MVNGNVHHFAAAGLYNGLALLRDEESGTFWDHITGEALHGPLAGAQLDIWGVEITTVEAARAEYKTLELHHSDHHSLKKWLMGAFLGRGKGVVHTPRKLMPLFRKTMQDVDDRLPEMTQGLGIFEGTQGVFYPMDQIPPEGVRDLWQGRAIIVRKGVIDKIPFAVYEEDQSSRPMQLLMRWYGFCLTFSESRICSLEKEHANGGAFS